MQGILFPFSCLKMFPACWESDTSKGTKSLRSCLRRLGSKLMRSCSTRKILVSLKTASVFLLSELTSKFTREKRGHLLLLNKQFQLFGRQLGICLNRFTTIEG